MSAMWLFLGKVTIYVCCESSSHVSDLHLGFLRVENVENGLGIDVKCILMYFYYIQKYDMQDTCLINYETKSNRID